MFTDRTDAGRQLAEALGHYAGRYLALLHVPERDLVPVSYSDLLAASRPARGLAPPGAHR